MSAAADPPPTPPAQRLSLWRLLTLSALLASLPTILAFGARWFWMFELATHFRVQYVGILLPITILALVGRRFRLAVAAGVVLLVNLSLILPVYLPASQPPHSGPTLRAITANVHTGNRSYDRLLAYIRAEQPDFFVVVEIDDRWTAALEPLRQDYPYAAVETRPDNFGLGLYSRLPIRQHHILELEDSEVPTLVAELESETRALTIVGAHPLPPTSAAYAGCRNRHLQALGELVSTISGPVVVLGDLNVTPWSPHFRDLLASGDLRDSRRGFGVQPTWPQQLPVLLIPIDHALVSPEIAVLDRRVGPEFGSDHLPIALDLGLAKRVSEPR